MPNPADDPRPSRLALWRAFFTFILVLLTILGGSWLVVGRLLVPILPGGWRTIITAATLFTIVPFIVFLGARMGNVYPGRFMRLVVFRPFWYAQMFLLFGALTGGIGAIAGLPFGYAGTMGRAVLIVFVVAYTIVMVAGYVGSRALRVREVTATFAGLPSEFDGLRIAQVSDLHVGPHSRDDHLRGVALAVTNARADVIAVTGDMVDDFPGDVARYAKYFGSWAAPYGVYAIAGNHDVYAGWKEVRDELEKLPITVLVNDSRTLERTGARIAIAGTGDPAAGPGGDSATGSPNIDAMLSTVPANTFVVALAHNPALWPALAKRGVDLTLSGHTHWGQFAIESRGWSLATPFLRHSMGGHTDRNAALWINPGTSYWGIPFRIGAASEVTIVTLRRGSATSLAVQPARGTK